MKIASLAIPDQFLIRGAPGASLIRPALPAPFRIFTCSEDGSSVKVQYFSDDKCQDAVDYNEVMRKDFVQSLEERLQSQPLQARPPPRVVSPQSPRPPLRTERRNFSWLHFRTAA
jgi:hypothetical protein